MLDHLLESFYQNDSNKWSNIEFGEEITQEESIEVNFMHLIWSSDCDVMLQLCQYKLCPLAVKFEECSCKQVGHR